MREQRDNARLIRLRKRCMCVCVCARARLHMCACVDACRAQAMRAHAECVCVRVRFFVYLRVSVCVPYALYVCVCAHISVCCIYMLCAYCVCAHTHWNLAHIQAHGQCNSASFLLIIQPHLFVADRHRGHFRFGSRRGRVRRKRRGRARDGDESGELRVVLPVCVWVCG